ncbi:MAG TPA: 5'/3'-nucleotidase SurE [Microthrixaceae bacterium]|nr:5'/3'-nucleotidase SurE [Microthrixaceae bacterium]
MRVLVTNDDGVSSVGLHAVARRLAEVGHEVVVVAPADDASGSGTGLGLLHAGSSIVSDRVELPGLGDIEVHAMAAPPAMCVLAASSGLLGEPPDAVVSGVNLGPNLGRAVLHSGTVGAALTAHLAGLPGVAVSAVRPNDETLVAAAELAERVLALHDEWQGLVVNLNVPSEPKPALRCARLAEHGAIRLAAGHDRSVTVEVDAGPSAPEPAAAGWPTDVSLVQRHFATLTLLSGIGVGGDTDQAERLVDTVTAAAS